MSTINLTKVATQERDVNAVIILYLVEYYTQIEYSLSCKAKGYHREVVPFPQSCDSDFLYIRGRDLTPSSEGKDVNYQFNESDYTGTRRERCYHPLPSRVLYPD